MKISASKALKGTVKEGVIDNQITIQLAGRYDITSIITKTSSDNLGLKAGKTVIAVIKATNVMAAVED